MDAAVARSWLAAQRALGTPFFAGILPLLATLDADDGDWPTMDALNALSVARGTTNANRLALRFVAMDTGASSAMAYEQRIASTGEIPTRANWHDLLNALQWLAFPRLKSAINAQHVSEIERQSAEGSARRSVQRDVLTMVDESGILVASHDVSLLECIRNFQWQELFVEHRDEVIAKMHFVLVGHGLLEKSLDPFIGLTAKALLLQLDAPVANADVHASLDEAAENWLRNPANLDSARRLAPLPLLGIPGWWPANEDASFYRNADYFRPGYRRLEPAADGGHQNLA